jgi:hypothetical protein
MALSLVGEVGGGVEADSSQAARLSAVSTVTRTTRKRLVVIFSSSKTIDPARAFQLANNFSFFQSLTMILAQSGKSVKPI